MRIQCFNFLPAAILSALSVLPESALADEFIFKLHGVTLGEATFAYLDPTDDIPIEVQSDSRPSYRLQVSGTTRGAVSLFKDYSASFHSSQMTTGLRHYRVDAIDRGTKETRHIVFSTATNVLPQVLEFTDRTQELPLRVSEALDQGRIDPLHALQNILASINRHRKCEARYAVYDGKRRYQVEVLPVDANNQNKDEAPKSQLRCVVTLRTQSVDLAHSGNERRLTPEAHGGQEAKPKQNLKTTDDRSGFWPFKKTQQTMVVHFQDGPTGFRFSAFEIASPVGTIRGLRAPLE